MNENLMILVMPYAKIGFKTPPFPLLFLSYALKKKGFDVKIVHCSDECINEAVENILELKPLLVGFSVLTGLPTYYAAKMSKKIKEVSNIPVVWGGIHPSLLPEQCLSESYIDFVVVKEGELILTELAVALKEGKPLDEIKGLGHKKNGKIIFNAPRELSKDLSDFRLDIKAIDWSGYINESDSYWKGEKIRTRELGYYSSRGCPHNCGFCYNAGYTNRTFRAHPEEHVLEDIEYLKNKYGINKIHFWDDNFFTNKERAFRILEKMNLYAGIDIRIDYFDDELARRLVEYRVVFTLIGGESGSNRILDLVNKDFTVEEMLDRVKILARHKLPTLYSFILGYPTETREELNQTVDVMLKIYDVHPEASFTLGAYLPYPGTELYELCIKNGFKPPSRTEDWNFWDRWRNTVNLPWLDKKMALNLRHLFAFLDFKLPFVKGWAKFRLRRRIFSPDIDIKIIIRLHDFLNKFSLSKKDVKS